MTGGIMTVGLDEQQSWRRSRSQNVFTSEPRRGRRQRLNAERKQKRSSEAMNHLVPQETDVQKG